MTIKPAKRRVFCCLPGRVPARCITRARAYNPYNIGNMLTLLYVRVKEIHIPPTYPLKILFFIYCAHVYNKGNIAPQGWHTPAGSITIPPMSITVTFDRRELDQAIAKFQGTFSERRLNAVIATAMTRTAIQARQRAADEMSRAIDRPTPYTIRQLRYTTATANRLVAVVGFNIAPIQDVFGNVVRYENLGNGQTPAGNYMERQIQGGTRRNKRFELALQAKGAMPKGWQAVPGPGARLDGYGNVSSGQIKQILSQVGTELTAGYSRTLQRRPGESDKAWASRKRNALGRAGGQYVAIPTQRGKLRAGVYLAEGRNFGRMGYGRKGTLVPVFFYVPSVRYTARFRFYETVQRAVEEAMPGQIKRAFDESAARLASKAS